MVQSMWKEMRKENIFETKWLQSFQICWKLFIVQKQNKPLGYKRDI